jgi:hypothetical protein
MGNIPIVEHASSIHNIPEDNKRLLFGNGSFGFDVILKIAVYVLFVRFAEFHEDIDIPGCFSEVDKSNNIGMIDLMPYFYFRPDPLDDIRLQFGL